MCETYVTLSLFVVGLSTFIFMIKKVFYYILYVLSTGIHISSLAILFVIIFSLLCFTNLWISSKSLIQFLMDKKFTRFCKYATLVIFLAIVGFFVNAYVNDIRTGEYIKYLISDNSYFVVLPWMQLIYFLLVLIPAAYSFSRIFITIIGWFEIILGWMIKLPTINHVMRLSEFLNKPVQLGIMCQIFCKIVTDPSR